MYPIIGPHARRPALRLDGPMTVGRKPMLLGISGHKDHLVVPIGSQLPADWRALEFTERQLKLLYQQGYLLQVEGKPWQLPPSDAERAAAAAKAVVPPKAPQSAPKTFSAGRR